MRIRLVGVALVLLAVAGSSPATARGSLAFEGRLLAGSGDDAGLGLWLVGAGVAWRLSPTLTLRPQVSVMLPMGEARDGSVAEAGFGGEVVLRFEPWPDAGIRPYGMLGAGLLLFPGGPFLPGGSRYDFVLSYGGGLALSLSPRWTLAAGFQQGHVSNGQGLGEHNPAFDGLGGGVTLAWSFADREELPGVWANVTVPATGRTGWVPGATFDASAGAVDGELLATGRLRLTERLADHLLALLDFEAGSLASTDLFELGLGVAAHWRLASVGGHAGHRWFAGIETWTATLQAEVHLTPEMSLVAMGNFESPSVFDDRWLAGAGLRLFPLASLAIDAGVGFGTTGDQYLDTCADPYLAVEWQLPLGLHDWRISVFIEDQISGVDIAGVRVGYGMGTTLRDAARALGWRRIR